MAETWFNSKTNKVEIRGEVDAELAEAALIVGYINAFNRGVYEVIDEISDSLPDGFVVVTSETAPVGAVRIGQVKVRTGDPEHPLYICRK